MAMDHVRRVDEFDAARRQIGMGSADVRHPEIEDGFAVGPLTLRQEKARAFAIEES
jgi:hypothetical protein